MNRCENPFLTILIMVLTTICITGCAGSSRGTGIGTTVVGKVFIASNLSPLSQTTVVIEAVDDNGEALFSAIATTNENGDYSLQLEESESIRSLRFTLANQAFQTDLQAEVDLTTSNQSVVIDVSVNDDLSAIEQIGDSQVTPPIDTGAPAVITATASAAPTLTSDQTSGYTPQPTNTPQSTTAAPAMLVPTPLPTAVATNVPQPTPTPTPTPTIPAPQTATPTTTSASAPPVLGPGSRDGLIAYWAFEEINPDGTTPDSSNISGSGRVLQGVTHSSGIYGKSVQFDCEGSRIDVPLSGVADKAISLSAWIFVDRIIERNFTKDSARIFVRSSENSKRGSADLGLILESDRSVHTWIRLEDHTSGHQNTGTNSIEVGKWIHIATTFEAPKGDIYLNGVRVDGFRRSGTIALRDGKTAVLGNNPLGTGERPFCGRIDEFRIYNRKLSEAEVRNLSVRP